MDLKTAARTRFEAIRPAVIALSHRIHAHPELGFEEEQASTWLAEMLTDAGFTVDKGICNLPTAFVARAGSGPLHLAICAEYDCLPGIGHACGHNLIAAMAVGAGIARRDHPRHRDPGGGTGRRWENPPLGTRRLRWGARRHDGASLSGRQCSTLDAGQCPL